MRSKILAKDYKEELANIAEQKRFSLSTGNLLLSMFYKTEDSFENYEKVKREVPTRDEFFEEIVGNVKMYCNNIQIAEPNTELAKTLKQNKCNIISDANRTTKTVITFPNEKNLLYGISKASIPDIDETLSTTEKSILTAILIGKCISISEVIRDFNGWSWSILPKEIESTECNIIYELLVYLYGYKFINNIDSTSLKKLKSNMPAELWSELEKVATQFYLSYDKAENERVLKMLAEYKTKLNKMKNQKEFVEEITEEKKENLIEIRKIDSILNNADELKKQYLAYNSKLPNEAKIFSVSNYAELLEKRRKDIIEQMNLYNKMQNPNEFLKYRDEIRLKVKFYETKTDITKFQNEFLKCFEKKIEATNDRKGITDLLYEIRYLNFIPNCSMKLTNLERMIIPKAINARVLNPISNNDDLDYRILKGIFETQVISLEGLYIKLGASKDGLSVIIFDGDNIEQKYEVPLPEGSSVQIRKSKKAKIFE